MIERFRNELQLARRISHKDVCRIYDLGNCEGTYFITMEYIAGDNLKSIIRMMGRFFWNKRTSEGMKRGLECFAQAIAKDPSFARAYTGISDCYGIFAYYYMPPRPTLRNWPRASWRGRVRSRPRFSCRPCSWP